MVRLSPTTISPPLRLEDRDFWSLDGGGAAHIFPKAPQNVLFANCHCGQGPTFPASCLGAGGLPRPVQRGQAKGGACPTPLPGHPRPPSRPPLSPPWHSAAGAEDHVVPLSLEPGVVGGALALLKHDEAGAQALAAAFLWLLCQRGAGVLGPGGQCSGRWGLKQKRKRDVKKMHK